TRRRPGVNTRDAAHTPPPQAQRPAFRTEHQIKTRRAPKGPSLGWLARGAFLFTYYACSVTTVLLVCEVPVSMAVTVQNPTVVAAVRVTVAWPAALVVAVRALRLVLLQVPPGLPAALQVTTSPDTGVPPTPVVT